MDYLKMEGKEKSGLRPDDGEGLALMRGAPRILLRSRLQIPHPSVRGKQPPQGLLESQLHCSDTSREAVVPRTGSADQRPHPQHFRNSCTFLQTWSHNRGLSPCLPTKAAFSSECPPRTPLVTTLVA